MKEKYDLNANIKISKYKLYEKNANLHVKISLENISSKEIVAIKFKICAKNIFGDIIMVDQKEYFDVIVQNISLLPYRKGYSLELQLPDTTIKELFIQEKQICFFDGIIKEYVQPSIQEIDLIPLEEYINDKIILDALNYVYGTDILYMPNRFKQGWLCVCGIVNSCNDTKCNKCNNDVDSIFMITDVEFQKKCTKDFDVFKAQEKNEIAKQKAIKEVNNRKKLICCVVAVICACIAMYFIYDYVKYSSRTVYDTPDEMKRELQGIYENEGSTFQIEIKGDQYCYYESYTEEKKWLPIEWIPNEGKIILTSTAYIVTKDGDLKSDSNLLHETDDSSELLSYGTQMYMLENDITIDSNDVFEDPGKYLNKFFILVGEAQVTTEYVNNPGYITIRVHSADTTEDDQWIISLDKNNDNFKEFIGVVEGGKTKVEMICAVVKDPILEYDEYSAILIRVVYPNAE